MRDKMDKFDHTTAIFVFGSNEGGWHGAGAARFALEKRGAKMKQAYGMAGRSFAIPTKDETIRHTLSLDKIRMYVTQFKEFASIVQNTHQFQVTCIGCGLAGLRHEDIAPMFSEPTKNLWFDEAWKPWLPNAKFWGTF